MARRKKSDDEGGGASWMDTYGDLVTLLLCFFVLLYSFSSVDSAKWQALVGAFSGSNSIVINTLDPAMAIARPIELEPRSQGAPLDDTNETEGSLSENEIFKELVLDVEDFLEGKDFAYSIFSDYETLKIVVRFSDNVVFESGRANIIASARPILDDMVEMFTLVDPYIEIVRIEGHTDNVPIRTSQFSDNWDLSVMRACNVLRYIIGTEQFDTSKISAVGYGEFHPVASNDTDEGKANNRRVDFVIESVKSLPSDFMEGVQ